MNKEQIKEMNAINWWHRIPLEEGIITPGRCKHGEENEDYYSKRFGIPLNLKNKTVLDVGCWDGLFSFEAEKRGAKVKAIDYYQNAKEEEGRGFIFARNILNSSVNLVITDLEEYTDWCIKNLITYDITFLFGVFYHSNNPMLLLKNLFCVTKEYALIETAIWDTEINGMEIRKGCEDDPTNLFYPSLSGLQSMLELVGFEKTELIWTDKIRATVKAIV